MIRLLKYDKIGIKPFDCQVQICSFMLPQRAPRPVPCCICIFQNQASRRSLLHWTSSRRTVMVTIMSVSFHNAGCFLEQLE